ncbi:MAG: phosphoribosylaminoimidazolesuccinocarboxamide synthase [Betaproteobacteria bacterium]|nr:phosphoribosylaminoimidazolesuccinocarboxamide synthase [Betaproteobacteria bacterium]MDE2622368.1 phosphoribosylaminoimidazolesuccinocarboxamide synthase [Betaproteobacteria bacterium]
MSVKPVLQTDIRSLPLVARGKVRDIYAVGDDHLLLVTTDRLSAFDVVFPTPIPGKGIILNTLTNFWFSHFEDRVPNHLSGIDPESVVSAEERDQVAGRSVVAKRMQALPLEAVVRGYIEGSGWKEYQAQGSICGIALPPGLQRAERLPQPLFTPATKAAVGDHDENIDFDRAVQLVGAERAAQVRDKALELYQAAADYAWARGIIIADTKFEFGLDRDGTLTLIDEVLTPDSSRFWPRDSYRVGESPESFDKQFVRNWLESIHWNKQPPAPELPEAIASGTAAKYQEALTRLTQR